MDQGDTLDQIGILVVFASPKGSCPLRSDSEHRTIKECLERGRLRERFRLEALHAATVHDVRRELLVREYAIVQFSGHGSHSGLVLEGPDGQPQVIPEDALASFLSSYSPPVDCVILNACYTDIQGRLLSMGVPWTIAIDGAIPDDAAIEFTRGFYDAYVAGKDIKSAFREGCHCVNLTGYSGGFMPQLFSRTTDSDQTGMMIVSRDQVEYPQEDEGGFLDYVIDGTEAMEAVQAIAARITARTVQLNSDLKQHTVELQTLNQSSDMVGLRQRKRIIDSSAEKMEVFAKELDQEIPQFRDRYAIGIDYYAKAVTMLPEFNKDASGPLEEALSTTASLAESIDGCRAGLQPFIQALSSIPRMTKKLNRAKRRCLAAVTSFHFELDDALQLTQSVRNRLMRMKPEAD